MWVHRLSEKDLDAMTAVCAACGPVRVVRSGPSRGVRCAGAVREQYLKRDRSGPTHRARRFLKDRCERCNFIAEDPCQLHVDHISGDWKDDRPENWQTLCQNCHALKSRNEKRARSPRPKAGAETEKDH